MISSCADAGGVQQGGGRALTAASVEAYLRQLADLMGLRDWRVDISSDEAPEGALAAVECVENRKFARVMLGQRFFSLDAEEQRHTLVHELVHCHVNPTHDAIMPVQRMIGEPAFHVLEAAHRERVEIAVDGLADVLAPWLPLPPWCEAAGGQASVEQVA